MISGTSVAGFAGPTPISSRPARMFALAAALLVLLTVALGSLAPSASAADRAFSPRFSTNDTGDILAIGNTLETCAAGSSSSQSPVTTCANAQNAAAATTANNGIINNSFNMVYVDTDADATTFNSSSANLSLPSGAQVLYAGLYWGGEVTAGSGGSAAPNATLRNTVKFKTPGGAYQTLTATTLDDGAIIYQGSKDVTALVQAAGNGAYTTANVQTGTGADRLGGWSLVIAYRDTTQPARNLTIFDGLSSINGSTGATIPVSGFLTPPAGAVKTELGFITYEGDAGLVGDAAQLNSTTLTDATHPANNFFNSHISRDGVDASGKTPDYDNQLGFDISYVKADGILANSATSANIKVTTSGDVYAPGVITFATEIYAPKINQTKSVVDDNGGQVEQGDTLTYTIAGTNSGQDGTSGFVLRDPIPANTVYVPGSIKVKDALNATLTTKSDTPANDQAEIDSGGTRVVARLGIGANGTVGGNIAPGASYTVEFKVKVNGPDTNAVPPGTAIPNTATASFFSQTTGTPLTAVSTATSTVAAPDLQITKTRSGGALVVGSSSSYTFAIKNVGTAKTQGTITVTDPLPANLTATSFTAPGWNCSGTTSVTCTRSDSLAVGQSADITVNVNVGAGTPSSVSNTATIMGGGDGNLTNNSSNDVSTATQQADIQLTKATSQSVVNIGDTFVYTLTVTNAGPSPATSVAISDPIPGEFTYLSDDAGPVGGQNVCIYNPPSGVLGCTIGTLEAGASKTIKVSVRAEADGATRTIDNTATAAAQQTDPTPGNNSATATVTVTGVDLALTKVLTSPTGTVNTGDPVVYALNVKNTGPSRGTAIVVKDVLPDGLGNPASATPGCSIAGGQLTCVVGDLPAGGSSTIVLTGTVAAGTTTLVNRAGVAGAEADPDPTNNAAEVKTPVQTPVTADVSITKTVDDSTPASGQSVVYTLTAKNSGPGAAAGVVVTDVLPDGVTFQSVSGTHCTQAAGKVTCDIGTLAPGATSVVKITAKVDAVGGGTTGTHQFTVNKVETQVDLDPGQTRTVTIDCGAGYVLTDGAVRVDAVDQGTGDLASVHVLASYGTSPSAYTATVRNDATGRAQAKLFGVCLSSSTSDEGGHSHALIVSGTYTTTAVLAPGRQTASLDCGPGKTPIQPGFDLGAGDGRLVGSEPTTSGTGWVFTVDSLVGGPTATFSIRCLDDHVTSVNGHTHTLGLERRTKTITVAPGQTAEVDVICADDAKGIVGDFYVDPAPAAIGNDPRPKTRTFKFFNPSSSPVNVRVGLLCLNDRTGVSTGKATVTNTGTVKSSTSDPDLTNNSATAVINVGGSALTRSGVARVTGSTVAVAGSRATIRVACLRGGPACVGTVQIRTVANRPIATRRFSVRAARTGTLIVTSRTFKTVKKVKLIVTGRDGRKSTRTVRTKKATVKRYAST